MYALTYLFAAYQIKGHGTLGILLKKASTEAGSRGLQLSCRAVASAENSPQNSPIAVGAPVRGLIHFCKFRDAATERG